VSTPDYQKAHEHAVPMTDARSGPLDDVKVVDFTRALSGPFCTMILGDMGADVIKVETPPHGDTIRGLGPFTDDDDEKHFGGYFASVNRNKRGVLFDPSDPDDVERIRRLVDSADVVVENFRPGVMEALGLGYEALAARNPALVYVAIRGFGDPRTGASPYSDWPTYDIVAQAMGGVVSTTGTVAGEHVAAGPSVGDIFPAAMAAVAALGALHHARRTGEGQFVDVAMIDAVMAMSESMMWRYSYTGQVQPPRGTDHPSLCPFAIYETGDGSVAIAAVTDRHWHALCEIIERPELTHDERMDTQHARVAHRALVREAIEGWTTKHTTGEVVDALAGRVAVGPVNNAPDLVASPHVAARDMLVAMDHPGVGRKVVQPNTPLRFAATPGGVYRRAPKLGEHNDEVFAQLGDDPADNEGTE
jgi:crotonobetainyl-CoA:carnitine CoA-transferase CaiB-like acyl-CoA transferase